MSGAGRGWVGILLLALWLVGCTVGPLATPTATPWPLLQTAQPPEPARAELERYRPWAERDDERGQRLVMAFDRALGAIAAAYLSESRAALGPIVIGPRLVEEWWAVIAAARDGPYRQSFRWEYRVASAVAIDPADRPVPSYRLIVAIDDHSTIIERTTGRVIKSADQVTRHCRFVFLHEEGGTLKVIGMPPVPWRFCTEALAL